MSIAQSKRTRNGTHPPQLELWGGVECTVNRVGDTYLDQLERNGHDKRMSDLDRFAEIGLRVLRYPVLWERIAPNGLDRADWSWADRRLHRLQKLNIRPIVGLLHHGSGPRSTSLIDPDFPERLAEYAYAVAQRYPWVTDFTPVNEPLTTARFSGLYGHWYPHGRDDATFVRALLNQCRGTVLAMRAIRQVNASARLIQTEDLGKIHSTPKLAYQAEFENHRRWLTFDLLCGKVNRAHPLWCYLADAADQQSIDWFLSHPCPPDIMGLNHYLTSERYLDHRLKRYPPCFHGSNGHHRYADVCAVRACPQGATGPAGLLRETWERYRLPLAVTEVHLDCTREEQLRWLQEVWDAAVMARTAGVDVRAVTVWSLLGSFDWNSLLTRIDNQYESGVFDIRGPRPRPTALARLVRELAHGREPSSAVLSSPGWWHRAQRHIYGGSRPKCASRFVLNSRAQPLMIAGATGTLGRALARLCDRRGLTCCVLTRSQMNITDEDSVAAAIQQWHPWALINAAGYVRVDEAECDLAGCHGANARGPAILAAACANAEIPLLTFSSDLVFDGQKKSPYLESDVVSPLSTYGRSKADAEAQVLTACQNALVIRTSAFFGPWDEFNFITRGLRNIRMGEPLYAAEDTTVSPTYVPDLVNACLDLLIDGATGCWHLANVGAITWADFARQAAESAGLDARLVIGRSSEFFKLIAPRPSYSVLGSERGTLMPPLPDALTRYISESRITSAEAPVLATQVPA